MKQILTLITVLVLSAADASAGKMPLPLVNVPTLKEWGLITAAVGLGLAGVIFAARRRKLVNSRS